MLVGVDSFADVAGQVASLVAETTGFAAVTPPGTDADSIMAVAQNAATTANFIATLSAGIEQLGQRAAETTIENTTFEALSVAGGAAVAAI